MKKQRPIRTRLMASMVGLTCGVLLAVMLAFNITVQSYIRSRISTQLSEMTRNVSEDRRRGDHGMKEKKDFGERPDRITGAEYCAAELAEDGSVAAVFHGDYETAEDLADYVLRSGLTGDTQNKVVNLESGTYTISLLKDPVDEGGRLMIYADVTSIMNFSQRVNTILLIIILTAVVLSILLSSRFARSFAVPVQTLSGFASEIGGGRLEQRDLEFRDTEFRELAESMNRMVGELKQAKQKQDTFFQNVSHELRTPLTSIRGNAEGIVCGIIDSETAGRVILSESDKLGGMVEDILYLSRIGKGRRDGDAEPIDLREVLSLCVSEQHAEAEKKGLSFSFDFDDDPVMLPIREQDAQQLFGNLISNAVRYARKEIRLSCRSAEGAVTTRVADDGAGISPDDLPHVFERFYKGKDGRHGIGLAIAKSAAEAWNGEIRVRNEDGAVFEVSFSENKDKSE